MDPSVVFRGATWRPGDRRWPAITGTAESYAIGQLRACDENAKKEILLKFQITELTTKCTQYQIAVERSNMDNSKRDIKIAALNEENYRLNKTLVSLRDRLNNNKPAPIKAAIADEKKGAESL